MKKSIVLLSVFLLFGIVALSQTNVPDQVRKEFTGKYPSAKSVKWSSESPTEFEAEFTMNGKEMSASFDSKGKWMETETELEARDLPVAVTATLGKEFPGFKVVESSFLESPEMKGYEILLKNGETSLEVTIDMDGKVVRKTDVTKEENEEKEEKKNQK
jgi:hypothetical protein